MAKLEKKVFRDKKAAHFYERAAKRVKKGIQKWLFNKGTRLYRIAKFENGSFQEADLNQWYPGTVAIAWPHLFGIINPHSGRARSQMSAINDNWDWSVSFADPGGFPWTSIGYAALLTRDCERVLEHADLVKSLKFPDFDYPFTVGDAGWLLRTLSAKCHKRMPGFLDGTSSTLSDEGRNIFQIEGDDTKNTHSSISQSPKDFSLSQNYPNPFNPTTTITFQLTIQGNVNISIYNSFGRLIRNFESKNYSPGTHSIEWDGRDDLGKEVVCGIYFYNLKASDPNSVGSGFSETKKMILIR